MAEAPVSGDGDGDGDGDHGLAALLADVKCFLFDFDGPLCHLFSGKPAYGIARRMRGLLNGRGVHLPGELVNTKDPHHVLKTAPAALRCVASEASSRELTDALHAMLNEQELAAAGSAQRTPHAGHLVRLLGAKKYKMAVTSNNSAEAIVAYLRRERLIGFFTDKDAGDMVFGRHQDPAFMKPHPHCVEKAVDALQTTPDRCLMLGDSPADVEAAQRAGVHFLGFAPDAERRRLLLKAGATCIVDSLEHVVRALPKT